jgi:hypothetical protein
MLKFAFDGYKKYAWGCDQLQPLTNGCSNWYGGVSLLSTPVDMLDTLHIAGLEQEFQETKELVLEKLNFDVSIGLKVFETNIRVLGGLLSAYELDGDKKLLDKAIELGNILKKAFDTPTGIPVANINPRHPSAGGGGSTVLAELGTMQLEMQYLSDVTGDKSYGEVVCLLTLEYLSVGLVCV